MHLFDSKALSRLGVFYPVHIFSRKPTHTFILQSWKLEPAIESLEKRSDGFGSVLGFQACPQGGREDVVGFGGSGAYFVALEV
jgi:hypothetical protein